MPVYRALLVLAACAAAAWSCLALAGPKTVCTITVNSPDEKDAFKRSLPPDDYRFVELVERGRPDWLASACRQGVRCDALVISGHFDGGTEFYTDRLDAREFLPVSEMERASCSESCPGVFAQLKEVYLFGCNTLNAEAMRSAGAEIVRSLVRSGYSAPDAERLVRGLTERHGESNRDRMRHIFKDVPVLYGFSSKAPLGRSARPLLERYFQAAPAGEVASGRVSGKLLGLFAPSSMTVASGLADSDPDSAYRRDVCHFSDDRLQDAQKLAFVHEVLRRDMAEVRMFLDHVERYAGSLNAAQRQAPAAAAVLAEIADDRAARAQYLEFARDADEPAVRARMMDLARSLGWLSPAEERSEFMRMIAEHMQRGAVGSDEVDLVCARNSDRALELGLLPVAARAPQAGRIANAAVLACLGSADGHARVLRALTSPNDDEVAIAQVYLHHRPIASVDELRAAATGIAQMTVNDAQVRALDTLAHQSLSDPESLVELASLYPHARTVRVQRAIAGILLRADYPVLARADLVRSLRQHRLKSSDGADVIDVLIRRLQTD